MKKFRTLLMAFASIALIGIYSCEHVALDNIVIEPDEIVLDSGATTSTRTIAVSMGEGFEWDVTSTADFIEVTHVTASSFTISIEPYITGTVADIARQGIVVVTSLRGDFPVIVTQDRYTGYDITVDPALTAFGADGGQQIVNVTSEGTLEMTYTPEGEWLTVDLLDGVLTVTAATSTIEETLTGTITITNEYNSTELTVTQSPATALTVDVPTIDFLGTDAAVTQTVTVTGTPAVTGFTVTPDPAWFTVTDNGDGTYDVTVTAANTTTTPLTGTITFTNGVTPDAVVTVNQAGLEGTLTVTPATPINFVYGVNMGSYINTPDAVTLTVTSQLPWTTAVTGVSPTDASWLTVTPSGGPDGTITVSAATNLTTTARSAAFTVTNGSATSSIITVTQNAVDTTLTYADGVFTCPATPSMGVTYAIVNSINSVLNAQVTNIESIAPAGDMSWFTPYYTNIDTSPGSGPTSGGRVRVSVTANNTLTPRSLSFTLTNGVESYNFTFTQDAAVEYLPVISGVPDPVDGISPATFAVTVTSIELPTFVSGTSGISASFVSTNGNQHTFNVTVPANTNVARTITDSGFSNTAGTAFMTINQDAGPEIMPVLNPATFNNVPGFSSSISVTVTSIGVPTFVSGAAGLIASLPSTTGDQHTFTVTVPVNSGVARTITDCGFSNTAGTATMTINQNAKIMSISSTELNIPEAGSSEVLGFWSATGWSAAPSDPTWLSVTPPSDTTTPYDGTVIITAADNTGGSARSGSVVFTNVDGETVTVNVTQAGV